MHLDTIHPFVSVLASLRVFARRDEGAITPLMLSIFLGLIVITGIAIDFARHETARAGLQDAVDRGVLAAVQGIDNPMLTVRDYVRARPIVDGAAPRVEVTATDTKDGRFRVWARASEVVDTIFLRIIGIDRMTAVVEATASEARPARELALALDVSSSMGAEDGLGTLREVTGDFAREMLRPGAGDRTTVSLVPFAGSVNPGPRLFRALGGQRSHEASSCLDLQTGDYSAIGLPRAARYAHVPAYLDWPRAGRVRTGDAGAGWCPGDPEYNWIDPLSGRGLGYLVGLDRGGEKVMTKGSVITAHASDPAMLEQRLLALRMHHGNSPQEGLKWALALLDPKARPMLESHGAMAGDRPGRPYAFDRPDGDKVVVMVTDGRLSETVRPDRASDGQKSLMDFGPHLLDKMRVRGARGHLLEQCRLAAEAGVNLFIVGLSLQTRTVETYRTCLGNAADRQLILTDRENMSRALSKIRRHLTDLRLEK